MREGGKSARHPQFRQLQAERAHFLGLDRILNDVQIRVFKLENGGGGEGRGRRRGGGKELSRCYCC